jgi:wnt family
VWKIELIASLINSFTFLFFNRASVSQAVMEPMRLCRQSTRPRLRESPLGRGRKAEICRKEPEVLQEIVKGAQVATKECQFQFRNRRWNCTTARKSLRKVVARGQSRLICISFEYWAFLSDLWRQSSMNDDSWEQSVQPQCFHLFISFS